jgi:hypothetical protein
MLLETHYPKKGRFGKDGTTYHFSMWDTTSGSISGTIWSPRDASRTGRLVHVANSLLKYIHQDLTGAELGVILKETKSQLGLS